MVLHPRQPVINLPERLGGAGWQEQREGASWQCLRGWHLHRPGWEPLAVHELQLWMDWASGLRSVGAFGRQQSFFCM